MLEFLRTWFGQKQPAVCRQEFPEVYSGFVDYLRDTLHAQGPACHPRESQDEAKDHTLPLRLPAVDRLVAIGDLHGDFNKTQRAFRLAGLIDEADHWCGGTTTAVQVGDQLDRGGNEIRVLYFLEQLQAEARKAGGALHILNGNHETINTQGRFTYATAEGMQDFKVWTTLEGMARSMKNGCGCGAPPVTSANSPSSEQENIQARKAALAPGGSIAKRFLAPHPVILQIGSTMFVHGGILPQHNEYGLERINKETREWFLGQTGPKIPSFLAGKNAVVWARDYSTEDKSKCNCEALSSVLQANLGAQRMVVGHTIQEAGINTACDNKVYRIDVGLSKGCGNGEPQVLEILNDKECRSLSEKKQPEVFESKVLPQKLTEPYTVSSFWDWLEHKKREFNG